MRRHWPLIVVGALAVLASGCTPEALQQIHTSIDPAEILFQGPVVEAVQRARALGGELAGAALALLGIYLWYLVKEGRPWVVVLKEAVWGTALCGWALSGAGTLFGLEGWIYSTGSWLGERFAPDHGLFVQNVLGLVSAQNNLFMTVINHPMDDASNPMVRLAQAVGWFASQQTSALFLVINSLGVLLLKELGRLTYVYLTALYWVLLPLVAWTAILRPTRGVFLGWVRTYVAIALWPMLWGVTDRVALALLMSTGFGLGGVDQGNVVQVVVALARNQLFYALVNLTTIFVYLGVPVASYKIVSGASASLTSLAH